MTASTVSFLMLLTMQHTFLLYWDMIYSIVYVVSNSFPSFPSFQPIRPFGLIVVIEHVYISGTNQTMKQSPSHQHIKRTSSQIDRWCNRARHIEQHNRNTERMHIQKQRRNTDVTKTQCQHTSAVMTAVAQLLLAFLRRVRVLCRLTDLRFMLMRKKAHRWGPFSQATARWLLLIAVWECHHKYSGSILYTQAKKRTEQQTNVPDIHQTIYTLCDEG